MPDLDPPPGRDDSPERDAFSAPDRDRLPAPQALEPATRDRVEGLFDVAFGRAYDYANAPDRGDRVMRDAQVEARTFGDVRALQALAAEGFGRAADAAMNAVLVDTLGTDVGRSTVLHALKDGPLTPGTGDDLVVLLDREAAGGFGHTAILIGNDHEGWTLHSKDGTSWPTTAFGPSTWTNEKGTEQQSGERFAEFDTLDAFFENEAFSNKYEDAVRVEFEPGDDLDRGDAARVGAEAMIEETYRVRSSSCAHAVEKALENAGIEGFSVRETRVLRSTIFPKSQFNEVRDLEGGDDVKSDAQVAWERRSASDGE